MNDTQRYAKTHKAWDALVRPELVGRRSHTLILMANGRRSERELSLLLGEDISELAQRLRQQGLLQDAAAPMATADGDEDARATGV